MMAVDVSTEGSSPSLGQPRELFQEPTDVRVYLRYDYDVAPDGRFVMVAEEHVEDGETRGLRVVQNWFAEFANQAAR
jgi:hypothetical protein